MAAIPPTGVGGAGPNPSGAFARFGGAMASIFSDVGAWSASEAMIRWRRLILLLKISIAVPAFMFVIGEFVGRFGVWQEIDWMVQAAQSIFAFGMALGALLTIILWVKIMIYGHGGSLASQGVASLHERFEPAIKKEKVEGFLLWLCGWNAWFIGALLILTYVPVYKSLTGAAILIAALLLMSRIMSAQWSKSEWPKKILSFFVLCVIVGQILHFVVPETHAALNAWSASQAARLTVWANTQSSITRLEAAAEVQEEEDITSRMEKNHARLSELRQKATKQNCAGVYCQADTEEYRRLQTINANLRMQAVSEVIPTVVDGVANRSGQQPAVGSVKAPVVASSSPRRARRQLGSKGLPPPPRVTPSGPATNSYSHRSSVVVEEEHSTTPTTRKRGSSGLPRFTNSELDSIFSPIH